MAQAAQPVTVHFVSVGIVDDPPLLQVIPIWRVRWGCQKAIAALQQPATPRIPAHVREVLSLPLGELELELQRLRRACNNTLVRSNVRSAMHQLERLLRWYHVNTSRVLQHLDTRLFHKAGLYIVEFL